MREPKRNADYVRVTIEIEVEAETLRAGEDVIDELLDDPMSDERVLRWNVIGLEDITP